MAPLAEDQMIFLKKVLESDLVPFLPPLLKNTNSGEQQQRKNLSRAFSAFALQKICQISPRLAAAAVTDDFGDHGIDAIYYHAPSDTLYVVQSKIKADEQFSQDEALSFCQGVRKLIKQDFSGFNKHIQDRLTEIEDAIDNCSHIKLVVAHTGSGISRHATDAINGLLTDDEHGEERLDPTFDDYDAIRVVADLQAKHAYQRIDIDIFVEKCAHVGEPRITYFGLVKLSDLVKLHKAHGKALYERNIRSFLGQKNEVYTSIQLTLATKPEEFVFLNNGVTALCQDIEPKSSKRGAKRLKLRGFSVVNGAQTIATSANFPGDIAAAKVLLTLIKARTDGDFGKEVTRARNHQNPVLNWNFAALDDEQERLRREIAHLDLHYAYKAEGADGSNDPNRIGIEEAAQALAMLQSDPRFLIWIKKEPAQLLDTEREPYKTLFNPALTAFQLVNAVRFYRYVQNRMAVETMVARGDERLTYKHGNYAVAWILAKRLLSAINAAGLVDSDKVKAALSAPLDQLRQSLWTNTEPSTAFKGPLALFRNQTDAIPIVEKTMIDFFELAADPAVEHKKKQQKAGQPYPEELFAYAISKAPQIGNLA